LHCEEIGIVREQGWVQVALDGGKIDAVVFGAGMVSRDKDAHRREDSQDTNVFD